MHWPAAYADFNVFRRRQSPELRCAVRQDRPVPLFIDGAVGEFSGTVVGEKPPAGFQAGEAHEAMLSAGYYLFRAPTSRN
ncbi:hypothetical protein [Methylobacterium sp. WL6]|uniref:hypothetical protein n=1 Tax=Methylobacterium sp. WL6 TaxID=2603901 RepID=UPI0011CA4E3A|nr:hypothetical protein [Methylobacterium sp. WL6]TXN68122.1 hypothetical protein FV230_13400 [Methylobacterium sp. WL6]